MTTKPERVLARQTRYSERSAFSSESEDDNNVKVYAKTMGNVHSKRQVKKKSFLSRFFSKLYYTIFWWKKRKEKEILLPVTLTLSKEEERKKRKKKKKRLRKICLYIFLIIILLNLIPLNIATLKSPNFTLSNSTNISPVQEQNLKTTMCSILLGTVPGVNYSCDYCWDDNSNYNVTTFCYLKTIWDNAFNITSFQAAGWMQNNNYCSWGGVVCDGSNNIIKLSLEAPKISKIFDGRINKLTTLKELSIIGNYIYPNNVIPPTIFQMENLEILTVSITGFTSPIPNTIDQMKSLQRFMFRVNNNITDPIPESLSRAPSLDTIVYQGQKITGVIPDFIGNSPLLQKSLRFLDLSHNSLTGTIPDSIMNLTKLESLTVPYNQLSGEFPPLLMNSPITGSLQSISFQVNNFSGPIPTNINVIKNLSTLNLQANKFTGTIPESLTTLRMTNILLSGNQLTGTIPPALGNSPLYQLWLDNNQFTGTIPDNICNRSVSITWCNLGQNNFQSLPAHCDNCNL